MTVKVVLFDLWGTLIEDEPAIGEQRRLLRVRMAHDALAAAGCPYEQMKIEAAFEDAGAALSRIHADGLDIAAEARTVLYIRHLDEALLDRLDDVAWEALHAAILTPALSTRPPMIAGADVALAGVKAAGFPTGLISNAGITPGFVLREILAGYGLWQHLDDAVFSDEVELAKPTAAIFERALDAFGVMPEEAVFVGDQPVLDVLGPRAAGLWSIQVGDLAEDGIEPHLRVASVADVLPAIAALGAA